VSGPSRTWTRQYPPLLAGAVALLMAAFVLPSALTLPQTNPTQTLEYAPVPPTDEDAPPMAGNLGSLGLGTSSAQAVDAVGGTLAGAVPPPAAAPGTGTVPRQKRCVGNPPRQTEDLLSPPCVGYFAGDNGGATAVGVTRQEVRVVYYLQSNTDSVTSKGFEDRPVDTWVDLATPPKDNEEFAVRMLRVMQRYYNDRVQTYGRHVHLWIYFDRRAASWTPEGRRADAASIVAKVHPFAVVPSILNYTTDFLRAMAAQKVLVLGSFQAQTAQFYRSGAPYIWSYLPSQEQQVGQYVEAVCNTIVKPGRVTFSGDTNGVARKLGVLSSGDPTRPELIAFARQARAGIEKCGGKIWADGTYPYAGHATESQNQQSAATNMARFRQAGVTTVIWMQGYETSNPRAAAAIGYHPEWVVAGDGQNDGWGPGSLQDQNDWDGHAWVVSSLAFTGPLQSTSCYRAYLEAQPDIPQSDVDVACNLKPFYQDLRLLFTGIQVAGPRLTTASVDAGFHAIPGHPSSEPATPACFFEPGDYTCIKDAVPAWWDGQARHSAGGTLGCWRWASGGRRYLRGSWPQRDILTLKSGRDSCNGFQGGVG
jgi:hypothetical protein